MVQAVRRTRIGLVACMASRSGSSTTALIATPLRVQRNMLYSTPTAIRPTTVTVSCEYETLTPPTRKNRDPSGRN